MKESIKKRIEAVRRGEVPEGYSTEHAMLFPDEWGTPVALNTVLSENKDRNEGLRFDKEDVLSVSGEQGIVNQIDLLGRSYAGESVAPYHVVETGDVVYTKSPLKENPYGIIKQNRGVPGIVSTLYAVYHCSTPITGQYLENYFCIDTYLNNYLKPLVKRGAKNDMKVNNEEVLLGRIPLPSLREQERINEIIAQFNRMIERKQSKIDELKKLKQVCLLEMFPQKGQTIPKRRFPGFSAPWEQRKFSDITFPAGEKNKDNLPLESYSITNEHGFVPQDEKFENGGTMREADKRMYYIVSPNSFAYNPARINVGSIGYQNIGKNVIVSSLYEVFKTSEDVDDRLLWHWFKSPDFQKLIMQLQEGGVRLYFYYDKLCMGEVSLPSLEEQRKIGKLFDTLDNLITLHQRELAEVGKYKEALMQLLLTGLVRVNA